MRGSAGLAIYPMPRSIPIVARVVLLATLAVASSALACVVGTGTNASCTESALNACLGGENYDGTVTFACGGAATITVTSSMGTGGNTTIDGGGLITISARGGLIIFAVTGGTFTVHGLTISNDSSSAGGAILDSGDVIAPRFGFFFPAAIANCGD